MADAFLSLPVADRRDILETAAARTGRPAAILEKDIWICRVPDAGIFRGSPKLRQWRSFLARDPLLIDEPDLHIVIRDVGDFIMPAALDGRRIPGSWTFDGGWRPST